MTVLLRRLRNRGEITTPIRRSIWDEDMADVEPAARRRAQEGDRVRHRAGGSHRGLGRARRQGRPRILIKTARARNDWTGPRFIEAGGAAGEDQSGMSDTHQREAEDALLNVNEVAAFLRVSPETVKYLRSQGRFAPAVKIGRRVMWPHSDLVAWRNRQGGKGRARPADSSCGERHGDAKPPDG